jgi:mannose-1-phosphate guanylyltransferase
VFPALVDGSLFGFQADDPYWIDLGTPECYLEATWDLLAGRVPSSLPARDETGSLVLGGSLVAGAHVGPQSVLGRSCSVGTDARVERAVLHDRVIVGADASVRESVLAEHVRVGVGARIGPGAMVGAGATIGDGAIVGEGARLDPGVEVEPGGRVAPGHTVAAGAG